MAKIYIGWLEPEGRIYSLSYDECVEAIRKNIKPTLDDDKIFEETKGFYWDGEEVETNTYFNF